MKTLGPFDRPRDVAELQDKAANVRRREVRRQADAERSVAFTSTIQSPPRRDGAGARRSAGRGSSAPRGEESPS